MNNFNFIAPFYDLLKRAVYGDSLLKAELSHLTYIQPGSHVLVLGGGTGKLLEALPARCYIDYVERSSKMIRLAKKRKYAGNINFIHADYLEFQTKQQYDWIITSFFLDVFIEKNLRIVCSKLLSQLDAGGRLLATDFHPAEGHRGKVMLQLMHIFFKLVSGLESNRLKNIQEFLREAGFRAEEERYFNNGNLFSTIFIPDGNPFEKVLSLD
ncbi:MAG: methyltransferase domain-containing protein [Cyclobacteriaceae bacterium]